MQICCTEFNYDAPVSLEDLSWDEIKLKCDTNDLNSSVIGDIKTFTLKNSLYETEHQVRLIDKCTTGEKSYKLLFESLKLIPDPTKKIAVTPAQVYINNSLSSPSIHNMFYSAIFVSLFPADLINVLSAWHGPSTAFMEKFGLLTKEQYDKDKGVLYYRSSSIEEWNKKVTDSVPTVYSYLKNTYTFRTNSTNGSVFYQYLSGTELTWKELSSNTLVTTTYCFKI